MILLGETLFRKNKCWEHNGDDIIGCKWNSFNSSWCNNSWYNVGGCNTSGLTGVISIGVTLVGAIVVSVL